MKEALCLDSLTINGYNITAEGGNQIPALPFGNKKSYSELLQEKDSQIFKLILENRELKAELDEMFSDLVDMDRKLTKVYRRGLFHRILNKRV